MWISRWGVGFPGSRITPFVGEPLSETRVPRHPTRSRPTLKPAPAFPAGEGIQLKGAQSGRKGRPACSPQASRCFLSYTRWERRQWDSQGAAERLQC